MKHVLSIFAAFAALAASAITTTLEYEDARETLTRAAVSNDLAQAIAAADIATPSMVTNIVIDVAPQPGNYAAVSNAAMNAAITNALQDAAIAGKASTADVTLTPIYSQTPTFSEWVTNDETFYTNIVWNVENEHWIVYTSGAGDFTPESGGHDYYATSLGDSAYGLTATRTRTDITGYTLGSQTDKPLQPKGDYAPAINITKTALAPDVQASLGKADTALQTAPVTSVNNKTGAVSLSASDVDAVGNSGNQTMNGLLRVYQNEYRLGNEVLLVGSKTFGLGLNPSQIIFFDNGIKYTIEVPPASGTLALTSDIPSVAGQTFNFATTQGVMDALKTVIETLGGTVINAPTTTISQGE